MKYVWDNLVWLLVVAAIFGTVKLSTVVAAAMSNQPLEQASRGAALDRQIGEVQARTMNRTDVVW
jgi:hypothetical protein